MLRYRFLLARHIECAENAVLTKDHVPLIFLFMFAQFAVLGEDLDASGGIVAVAIARNDDRPLALLVHRNSGALVWDIR